MMTANTRQPLDDFLDQRIRDAGISSTALVFTFFCDVVTQHGCEIWLGNVIRALAPLGISERLTRTAVYRLVQDGWLESRKHGRRSYYRLTRTGENYYQRAASRIYASAKPGWDGSWTLLFTSMVAAEKRDALQRGLSWLGYGRLGAGVFALPRNEGAVLDHLLEDLDLQGGIVRMQAQADDAESMQQLVLARWKLDELRQRYREFNSRYSRASKILDGKVEPPAHSQLLLRILLIHEYRKILLNDPELPADMLPADWEAFDAQALTGRIYRRLAVSTSRWAQLELFDRDSHEKPCAEVVPERFPLPEH
jgi:phenylacetic acid degradation operon negative regulatory protein